MVLKNPFSESSTVHQIYHLQRAAKERKCHNLVSAKATNSFNNTVSFGHVSNLNIGSADERTEILAWLSPLDPWIRHLDIGDHRVEDVGDWLLGTEEYRNWVDGIPGGESDNSALFCYGDPGGRQDLHHVRKSFLHDFSKGVAKKL